MKTQFLNYLFILLLIIIALYLLNLLTFIYYTIIIIIFSIFGIYFAIKSNKSELMKIYCFDINTNELKSSYDSIDSKLTTNLIENYFKSRTLISKNVDELIEQIIDLCLRDFVLIYYKKLVINDDQSFQTKLKNEIWEIIANILVRIRSIDFEKFFTANIVNRCLKHFQKITICLSHKESQTYYSLSSHLDNEKEIEFLRKLSDFLLTILLPKHYSNSKALCHLLREILSVQVFLNGIQLVCDSHYLNQKLLDYLKWHKKQLERHRKTYAYAETYEDFIKVINQCCDMEDLKRIRFQIISEIMEASVINDLKRERGIDLDKGMFSGPITSAKGDLLQARNLKRYINQLNFAKNQCEKRINAMNSSGSETIQSNLLSPDVLPQPNRKTLLNFKVIMHSDICRSYLKKFMQYSLIGSSSTPENRRHLIVFWESVEELNKQEISKQYQIANQILSHSNFSSTVINFINLPKTTLKAMEEFVLGNKGSEAFFKAQDFIYEVLEHRYYPLFIVSKEYEQMLDQFQDTLENSCDVVFEQMDSESDISEESAEYQDKNLINSSECIIDVHVSHTKSKLEALRQKLNDKRNALKALKKTETEREKPLNSNNINVNAKLIQMLEKEIDELLTEHNQFDVHLECTEMWINGIGKWKTEVHNIELDNTVGSYIAIIIVHRIDITETSSNGWVLVRTNKQLIDFQRKIIRKFSFLKKFELPKLQKNSKDPQLKSFRQKLETFLNLLTSNEKIWRSEELYLFLSQSAETLRQPIGVLMKQTNNKPKSLPFANLFGISYPYEKQSNTDSNSEDNEQLDKQFLILDDFENKDNIKDDIAEPLYSLMNEIFELRGVSKWLRRSLVTYIQVSYGQTINKQLRLTVEWICSESMIHYYLTSFRDSIWPNGTLSDPWPHPSDEEKIRTQTLAKQHLLNSIPELMNQFLGQQNVKKGIVKVFDGLQNEKLNKQLFYELLETFMFEFAPELKSN